MPSSAPPSTTVAAIFGAVASLSCGGPWDPSLTGDVAGLGLNGFDWLAVCEALVRRHPTLEIAGRELESRQRLEGLAALCSEIFHGAAGGRP